MLREFKFLLSLWKTNLAAAMEYRVAFLSQSIGMILNDAVYFIVWIIFFDRFPSIRGWQLTDMFLVFGISASAFGLAGLLFGNAFNLGDIIVKGRLDYYLSLPRPTLLHVLASRVVPSSFGDFLYGFHQLFCFRPVQLGRAGTIHHWCRSGDDCFCGVPSNYPESVILVGNWRRLYQHGHQRHHHLRNLPHYSLQSDRQGYSVPGCPGGLHGRRSSRVCEGLFLVHIRADAARRCRVSGTCHLGLPCWSPPV